MLTGPHAMTPNPIAPAGSMLRIATLLAVLGGTLAAGPAQAQVGAIFGDSPPRPPADVPNRSFPAQPPPVQYPGQAPLQASPAGPPPSSIQAQPLPPVSYTHLRQAVDQSIQIIERRVNELGLVEPTIQGEGASRILVQVPGLQDPSRLKEILGKTAKLDFRMVDASETAEQAAASHCLLYTSRRSEERRVGKECRSRWSPYH